MTVTLEAASLQQASVIENLMQLYIHDFTSFSDEQINAEGKFDYPYLAFYWEEPDRYPYLIFKGGKLAGFVLVRRVIDPENGQSSMEVAEFFVLRGYRRQGIGDQAALLVFAEFPGNWHLSMYKTNKGACAFWPPLVSKAAANEYSRSEDEAHYFYHFSVH